jgi:ZIP family zinc transporter/zinc and cadmium transporter
MLLQITLFGLVAGLANFAGAGLVLWREAWVRRWSLVAISLAAGAMATTAITHLFPEAVHVAPTSAPLWALGGFAAFYLLYNLVSFHACSGGPTHLHPIGTLALAGILVHSFFDGVAVGAGFTASDATGRVVTGAVFAHQLPEGAYTLAILLHTGMSRQRAVSWTLIDSLVTPVGAITAGFVSQELHAAALPALLGISSGTFLYVAASNLVPETQRQSSRRTALAFLLGIALVLGMGAVASWFGLGHDHGAHPADAPHPHPHPDPGLSPDPRHGAAPRSPPDGLGPG